MFEREAAEADAERVRRHANWKMAIFSVLFLLWQISYFLLLPNRGEAVRSVDIVRTLGFLVWVIALLMFFATGGAMFKRRKLRRFLDDERAVAVRATSYRAGFWAMIALCIIGYVATLGSAIRAVDVVHLVLSGGVLAVLSTQVFIERG
jgi:Flp pilus assembly pilin Flp